MRYQNNILISTAILAVVLARPDWFADMRYHMLMLFYMTTLMVFTFTVANKLSPWVALLLPVTFFSHFYTVVLIRQGNPLYQTMTLVSYTTLISVIFGILWYYLSSEISEQWFFWTLRVVALTNIILLTGQHFGYDPVMHVTDNSAGAYPTGWMSNQNEASALLAFTAPSLLSKRWCLGLLLIGWGFFCTKSSGGPLALLAGLSIYFILKGYWQATVAIITVGVWAVWQFDSPYQSFLERIGAWWTAFELYKENWITGWGLGQFKLFSKAFSENHHYFTQHLHNDIAQAIFECGIAAGAVFIGYFISFVRKIRKMNPVYVCAIVTIAVNSMVNFPFHIAATAMVAITWMALTDKGDCKDEKSGLGFISSGVRC